MEEMLLKGERESLKENKAGICVFSTSVCPKCRRLKQWMKSEGIAFKEMDMESPEGRTELMFAGVFALEAPVLQVGSGYFTTKQIFQGNEVKEEIKALLGSAVLETQKL